MLIITSLIPFQDYFAFIIIIILAFRPQWQCSGFAPGSVVRNHSWQSSVNYMLLLRIELRLNFQLSYLYHYSVGNQSYSLSPVCVYITYVLIGHTLLYIIGIISFFILISIHWTFFEHLLKFMLMFRSINLDDFNFYLLPIWDEYLKSTSWKLCDPSYIFSTCMLSHLLNVYKIYLTEWLLLPEVLFIKWEYRM